MDINKLVKDITNVFNGNTHSIKRKKYDDDLNDGIKYLSNKEKRLKHLENRIQMISGNNVEGMENIDYMAKGHTRVKMLNDVDIKFIDNLKNDYNGNLTTYKNGMRDFVSNYKTIVGQVKQCQENLCGDIIEENKMAACNVGCKLRSPILDGKIVKCEDKYDNQIARDACDNAYDWKDSNGNNIKNDLSSDFTELNTLNDNLKTTATTLFNRIAALRQQNNNLMQKTYNAEASMGKPADVSINSEASNEIPYQGKGKMKEFQQIRTRLNPGSNPNSSLTPAQIILRIMEKDSIARVDAITLRTYLWIAGTIGIVGGTIYYINKNSD